MLTPEQVDDLIDASRQMEEGPSQLVRRIEAAVREQCAVAAWSHYMDTCRARKVAPSEHEHWNAVGSVRRA